MGIMSNYPCSTIVCSLRFSQICSRVLSLEKMTIHWRRNRLHVNSCKSRHLLFQFWAKTSHFGGQPPVSSLPPLIHTWCISPAQSLKHHHIASLCKALFFPQMICSAAAGWPWALREAPWAEPGVTLGLWAKQQLQAQAVKRPTQLRLSDIL